MGKGTVEACHRGEKENINNVTHSVIWFRGRNRVRPLKRQRWHHYALTRQTVTRGRQQWKVDCDIGRQYLNTRGKTELSNRNHIPCSGNEGWTVDEIVEMKEADRGSCKYSEGQRSMCTPKSTPRGLYPESRRSKLPPGWAVLKFQDSNSKPSGENQPRKRTSHHKGRRGRG